MTETHLVKLGQGDYTRQYVRAVPTDEIPAELVDAFRRLLVTTMHVQTKAHAAISEMDIQPDHPAFWARSRNAAADLAVCAESADETVRICQAVAKLVEDLQR